MRKRLSIVVQMADGQPRSITKGALNNVLAVCTPVQETDLAVLLEAEHTAQICQRYRMEWTRVPCSGQRQMRTYIGYVITALIVSWLCQRFFLAPNVQQMSEITHSTQTTNRAQREIEVHLPKASAERT